MRRLFSLYQVAAIMSRLTEAVTTSFHCHHNLPWEKCERMLPAEQLALDNFFLELSRSTGPSPSSSGRGIVMSGGPKHVVQALANLEILRSYKSYLPVEFWHPLELEDAHCEALAAWGARCRELMPGVYGRYGTIVPAVMSSSFQHVLWMDTDVTPLVAVDLFFETDSYQRYGAIFWTDHWSQDCEFWGESSWPNFVALKLLGLKHNASDRRFSQEQETGLFLIDKLRHWRVIYFANYLCSRHFFTQILYGNKDAFRLAFLKLNVPYWLSPVRPGLAGTLLSLFYSSGMVQFWPCGEVLGDGHGCASGRDVPVFIHQKKHPGPLWTDILTFRQPMGQCTRYELAPLDVTQGDTLLWDVANTNPKLAQTLFDLDLLWDKSFAGHFERLKKRSTLTEKNKQRLAFGLDPFQSRPWNQMSHVCRCDFGNNFWLYLLTYLISNQTLEGSDQPSGCKVILQKEVEVLTCPVGFATLALLCHRTLKDPTAKQKVKQMAMDLRPAVEKCLPLSFWPLKLDQGLTLTELDPQIISELTEPLRKCLPLTVPDCWLRWNTLIQSGNSFIFQQQNVRGFVNSCVRCCGGMDKTCWDDTFTEERCCNQLDANQ